MYGTGTNVTALPATGVGAAAVAIGTESLTLATIAVVLLAIWTLQAAARAGWRIVPREEQ